jgi:hypothetical protein
LFCIAHLALSPARIFLDWDWTVRIGGFGQSTFINNPPPETQQNQPFPSGDCRFVAPECYEDGGCIKSDVFSFALILYELIVGKPGLSLRLSRLKAVNLIVLKDYRPQIPDSVPAHVKALIEDCWATNPTKRPTFKQIIARLEQMGFKLIAGVKSAKVAALVKRIEDWELEYAEPRVYSDRC